MLFILLILGARPTPTQAHSGGPTGKVWIAKEGGHVVQASLQQDGPLNSLGPDAKGLAEWKYNLTRINQSITPDLPKSRQHLLGDIPLPADAANESATDGSLTYSTETGVGDLVNFYDDKLKQAGWVASANRFVGDTGANLSFSRQDKQVVITAGTAVSVTSVVILYR